MGVQQFLPSGIRKSWNGVLWNITRWNAGGNCRAERPSLYDRQPIPSRIPVPPDAPASSICRPDQGRGCQCWNQNKKVSYTTYLVNPNKSGGKYGYND